MADNSLEEDPNDTGPPSAAERNFKWTKARNTQFIELRRDHADMFTGMKDTAASAWTVVLKKMGIEKKITHKQAKKKWENLKKKYKECKYPKTGEGVEGGKSTAATWPFYELMDQAIGARHSINPPVLIASVPDDDTARPDTPGPGTAAGSDMASGSAAVSASGSASGSGSGPSAGQKKKGRDEELLTLLKEDMRLQREAEERRAEESRERMDRLFSLLERMADK